MRVEQVLITPLIDIDTYGDQVDVSKYVKIDGLSKIKRSIDSTDYSIGVYTYADLRLKCENATGVFNENDSRSIFQFSRDKSLVCVKALEIDSETNEITTELQYDGIINDEATRQNITNDQVTMIVLSKDSVFRTTRVSGGSITNGSTVKEAIISILSQTSIEAVLTITAANIDPSLNYIIDNAPALDNLTVKEALDFMLAASSSVLLIRSDVVYVQARENEEELTVLELKGRGELSNNANIISISSYNSGKQRQFNSVILNSVLTVSNDAHVFEYGLRQKKFDFPMISSLTTLFDIGTRIVEEFKEPKIELKLRVPTVVSNGFDLLDIARIDAPWLRKPLPGFFMPVLGVAVLGDSITPLPTITGSLQILRNLKFKIISIEDDPKSFVTILKLRQFGVSSGDGVFDESTFAILGKAILGIAILGKG